jgi:hypothetical protein
MSIKTATLDTAESPTPYWAVLDRRVRNTANKSLYTVQQVTRAIRLRDALSNFYNGTFYDEPSYGTTGISVKVGNPRVRDRKALRAYEAALATEGITKKVTPQGVLYRIKK